MPHSSMVSALFTACAGGIVAAFLTLWKTCTRQTPKRRVKNKNRFARTWDRNELQDLKDHYTITGGTNPQNTEPKADSSARSSSSWNSMSSFGDDNEIETSSAVVRRDKKAS